MDDVPRQKLRAILSAHGRAVCDDGQRIAKLLAEVCPEHPREVEVLSQALDELVADEALASLGQRPWKVIANQLVDELVDRHSMTEDDARWAATSWGIALGEVSPDQPGSQLAPLPTNGSEIKVPEGWRPAPESWKQVPPASDLPLPGIARPQGIQLKTMVLMVIAIVAGLIASSMVSRLVDTKPKENLYRNQPTSYWSQKLQEPIRRKVDPAADLRRGDPDAVPVLIELLKDDNSIVRQEAILILARIGPAAGDAVPALQRALNDSDEQVRARAITALRQIELASPRESGRP